MDTVVESAPYPEDCITCGTLADATVVEILAGGRHEWDLHGACPSCGNEWYECDFGPPPSSVRAAILAANGPSVLDLAAASVPPAAVMRVLPRSSHSRCRKRGPWPITFCALDFEGL